MSSSYHHGSLREALVEAALQLIEEKGVEGFSLREAARRAGVSPAAPYRHFADKAALLRAAASRTRTLFTAYQEEAMAQWELAPARFRAMGVSAVVFAVQRPELFRLLTDRRWRDPEDPELLAQEAHARHVMAQTQAAAGPGLDRDPVIIGLAAQAMTYGLARMFLDGHMTDEGVSPEQAEEIATAVLDVLGVGFFDVPEGG